MANNGSRQRGIALVIVLWAAVLLAMLATGVSRIAREDVVLARNLADGTQAELAADSGVQLVLELVLNKGVDEVMAGEEPLAWDFAGGEIRAFVTDERGRIDVNAASEQLLADLFTAAGVEAGEAARLAAGVVEHRSELQASTAGQARGFGTTEGLMSAPGLTRSVFDRVADAVTVYSGLRAPPRDAASALVAAALDAGTTVAAEGGDAQPPAAATALANARADRRRRRRGARLLRIHAEGRTAGGSVFAREAVILIAHGRGQSNHHVWLWRRGQRRLF